MSTFITSIPVQSRLLLAKFENKATNKCIEIWKTTCIVTNFGKSTRNSQTDKDDNVNDNDSSSPACTVLINPANPELSGVSKFAYFPAGGPVPKHINNMHSNSWGGMDAGDQMLYPAQVVDGLVHQLGGTKLGYECKMTREMYGGCPIGSAVSTSQGGARLIQEYDRIIHTSPPFYKKYDEDEDEDAADVPMKRLRLCYRAALHLAYSFDGVERVACPLIGAGARGFPLEIAINVAASEISAWGGQHCNNRQSGGTEVAKTVAFGVQNLQIAKELEKHIKQEKETWSY